MPTETDYFLHRSQTEAIRSIAAADRRAAAAHQELCLLYVGRAVAALIHDDVRRR